jgi:putative oxidoreductase
MISVVPFTVDHGLMLVRIIVGLLLFGHGAQKLFGWFGGYGLKATADWLGSLGVRAPAFFAALVGLFELLGGLCFALGLVTPLAALAISAVMLGAIALVHWPNGIWVSKNGLEYPLVILAVAAAVGMAGPGSYALDAVWGIALPRAELYLVGLAVEIVALIGILAFRGRKPAVQQAGAAA